MRPRLPREKRQLAESLRQSRRHWTCKSALPRRVSHDENVRRRCCPFDSARLLPRSDRTTEKGADRRRIQSDVIEWRQPRAQHAYGKKQYPNYYAGCDSMKVAVSNEGTVSSSCKRNGQDETVPSLL